MAQSIDVPTPAVADGNRADAGSRYREMVAAIFATATRIDGKKVRG